MSTKFELGLYRPALMPFWLWLGGMVSWHNPIEFLDFEHIGEPLFSDKLSHGRLTGCNNLFVHTILRRGWDYLQLLSRTIYLLLTLKIYIFTGKNIIVGSTFVRQPSNCPRQLLEIRIRIHYERLISLSLVLTANIVIDRGFDWYSNYCSWKDKIRTAQVEKKPIVMTHTQTFFWLESKLKRWWLGKESKGMKWKQPRF